MTKRKRTKVDEFEDTKVIRRSRKSKERQHNEQKKQ